MGEVGPPWEAWNIREVPGPPGLAGDDGDRHVLASGTPGQVQVMR